MACLVQTRRQGTQLYYRLANDHVRQLIIDAMHHSEHAGPGADSALVALHGPGDIFAGADERFGATKSELAGQDPDRSDAVDAKEPDIVTEAIPR
jgi:hypothetical protein